MTNKGLNRRQRKFVNAFLETGNATESARRAGYGAEMSTDNALSSKGSQLLRNVKVLAAIEAKEALLESSAVASQAELREFWTAVTRGAAALPGPAENHTLPSMRDRLKASEMLGKAKAMFGERKVVGGPGGAAIETRVVMHVDDACKILRQPKESKK